MTEAITRTDIKNFNNDGVVVLRGVFNDWIKVLSRGAEFHINHPSENALIHKQDNYQGQLMEDFCNWQRISEYKDFVLLIQVASKNLRSEGPQHSSKAYLDAKE